jgi:hypothetical protein
LVLSLTDVAAGQVNFLFGYRRAHRMAIVVHCSRCKTRLTLGDDRAGLTFECPQCATPITVPTSVPDAPVILATWDPRPVESTGEMVKQIGEELSQPNNRLDDLLPVLRDAEGDSFSEIIVNRPVGPGLGAYLAHVNWTQRQTAGTRYVLNRGMESLGKPGDELMEIAFQNLASGLQIEAVEVEGERTFIVRHALGMGASAIGLADFHTNASQWTEADELFVGFPNPSVLFVTKLSNAKSTAQLRQVILTSDYWGAIALTPACYRLTAAGLERIATRNDESQ